MSKTLKRLAILASFVLLPSIASAQASIAGVVKDASGLVLPGVTVEASSPALIEKTRTVVTDGTGQYKIVDLVPGTYTVKFTLTGFNTVTRAGIELSGSFAAPVNADLKVGSVEETITVTGETPIVDVQSAKTQAIISKDIIDAIPTGRSHNQIVALIPGLLVAAQDVGGAQGIQTPGAGQIHGGTSNDGRLQSDGLNVGYNGGSANMWMSNASAAQETVVSTSGGLGEAETGGVVVNIVPRSGGNTYKGSVFVNGAAGGWAASNFTDDLQAQGLRAPNTIKRVYDFNPMIGGPLVKDRLWFFVTSRIVGADNYVAGMFINRNAPTATSLPGFGRVPDLDLTSQAVTDNKYTTLTVRLTAAAGRSKFNTYFDTQDRCVTCTGGGTATTTVEATSISHAVPSYVAQGTWQLPVTSRLLLEAGYSTYNQRWGGHPRQDGWYNPALTNLTEQTGNPALGIPAGLSYRQPGSYSGNWTGQQNWRASASYVTGAHSMKFGYLGVLDRPTTNTAAPTGFTNFQLNLSVPNRMSMSLPIHWATVMKVTSFYAQDQWTTGRWTLQGGLRYDRLVTEFSGGDAGDFPMIDTNQFLSAPIFIGQNNPDLLKGTSWNDVTPRMAISYDLFGNGKTAVKVVVAKYVTAPSGGGFGLNPINRVATTATRSWTDNSLNSPNDLIPQCNFSTSAATAQSATTDTCGPASDLNFGTANQNGLTYDKDTFNGWGKRGYEWDFSASVQREIIPRVSLSVGWFRRMYGNFTVTDNLALTSADFDQFSYTAPVDPRLGDASGRTITNLYDAKPTSPFNSVQNYIASADAYGNQWKHWNGVDVNLNGRLREITFQFGTSTGRDSASTCAIRAALPETAPTNPNCLVVSNYLTQAKGLVSYVVPRLDVSVAATFQSVPNFVATGLDTSTPGLAANQNVLAQNTSLGRLYAGGNAATTKSINLIPTGTLYGDRVNQIDLRFGKILRYRGTRSQVSFDLYNLLNSNAVQTYNQTYVAGGAWLAPTSILQARFFKLGLQFDF